MPRKVKAKPPRRNESVSRTLLEFARPLLELYGPNDELPTQQAMEELLRIATTIWNAFVLDARGGHEHSMAVEDLVERLPEPIAAAAKELIRSRASRYGDVSWGIGDVRVVADGRGGFSVRAEAHFA